ncbi:MAG: DegT/DnrJ/EryC1/StrS family aminotransferase [Candidatus Omnitrophota bacterium]
MKVSFLDLHAQYRALQPDIDRAIRAVTTRQDFVLGKDVSLFEQEFAMYCSSRYCIGVNSGTDALFLCLKALGIGPGDEVIVPVFTFIATAFVVTCTGARPVFVDIDEKTFNIDVGKIERLITKRTRAVIPVHLFGQCADMRPLNSLCRKRGLAVVEDACQAHGALYKGAPAGTMCAAGCFSFYPTKNLGGWGDGGVIVTDKEDLYKKLRMMRDCGRKSKYEHHILGFNSRLDTLQAAVLRVKLKYLNAWNEKRIEAARLYSKMVEGVPGVDVPYEVPDCRHVYHIYAIQVDNRDKVVETLHKRDIGCMVNYPIPLHLQVVYKELGYRKGDFPVAEKLSRRIISLPMHPFITKPQIEYVVKTIKNAVKEA